MCSRCLPLQRLHARKRGDCIRDEHGENHLDEASRTKIGAKECVSVVDSDENRPNDNGVPQGSPHHGRGDCESQ